MENVLALMKRERFVLIFRGVRAALLPQTVLACADAGVVFMETAFDHTLTDSIRENAENLRIMKKAAGARVRFGAGTVLTPDEVRAAADAGAEYIVCPHTDEAIMEQAQRLSLPVIPGALTPTEIMRAWNLGAGMVKLFPADALGPRYIQSLRAPLRHIPLLAAGGMNAAAIPEYLRVGVSVVATSSTVLQKDLLAREDFAGISDAARKHLEAVRSAAQE